MSGRGFAYQPRGGSYVATVAEVSVNRKTGQVRVTKFTCGQDCGLVVHQKNVLNVIEANLMQSMSRALYEGVTFDAERVNAVDWLTYPTIDIRDVPEVNAFWSTRMARARTASLFRRAARGSPLRGPLPRPLRTPSSTPPASASVASLSRADGARGAQSRWQSRLVTDLTANVSASGMA